MGYIIPIGIVVGVGLVSGVILTLAAKFMAVPVDETAVLIREALPGANCGGCGYAGCDDYAGALAADHSLSPTLCTPGGAATAEKISEILGVEFGGVTAKYAVVRCSGTCDKTEAIMDYQGIQTCEANKTFFKGKGACQNACLGFGDCVSACAYDALHIRNGIAMVDKESCIGCGACVKKCPNNLIEVLKADNYVFVGCSSPDTGAQTRKICKAGCIGCKKCEKICKFDAIHVEGTVAKIDYEKCKNCGMCVKECPVGVIKNMRVKKVAKAAPAKAEAPKTEAPKTEAPAEAVAESKAEEKTEA